jgi:hypothetical protein
MTTIELVTPRPAPTISRESDLASFEGTLLLQRSWLGVQVLSVGDVIVSIQDTNDGGLGRVQSEFCAPAGGGRARLLIPMADIATAIRNDSNDEAGPEGLGCPEDIVVMVRGDAAMQRLKIEIAGGVAQVGMIGHDNAIGLAYQRASFTFEGSPHTVVALGRAARAIKDCGYDVFPEEEAQIRRVESDFDDSSR